MKDNRVLEDRQWNSDAPMPNAAGASGVDKAEKYKWAKINKPGFFQWIDKKSLRIDLSYQREPVSEARIVAIARAFSWEIFGVVNVARTERGDHFVTDGAHRVRAALLRGDVSEVPCMVFESSGQQYEASQFVGLNTTSKGVSAYDRHRAGLVAGAELAVMAEEIITRHGYKFAKNTASRYETVAVGAVHGIVGRNADIADSVIAILTSVADGLPIKSDEIKGLFYVINTNQSAEIDWYSFPLKNLSEAGIGMIHSEIKRTAVFRGKGGEKVFGEAIAEIINKGQVKHKVVLPS